MVRVISQQNTRYVLLFGQLEEGWDLLSCVAVTSFCILTNFNWYSYGGCHHSSIKDVLSYITYWALSQPFVPFFPPHQQNRPSSLPAGDWCHVVINSQNGGRRTHDVGQAPGVVVYRCTFCMFLGLCVCAHWGSWWSLPGMWCSPVSACVRVGEVGVMEGAHTSYRMIYSGTIVLYTPVPIAYSLHTHTDGHTHTHHLHPQPGTRCR